MTERQRFLPEFEVAGHRIGPGNPCFVIAEAGVNHNGSVETALRMVDAAADAGADAVKFQTFIADKLASQIAPRASYQIENSQVSSSQVSMLKKLELSVSDHRKIIGHCQARDILFLSTPFDETSADRLRDLNLPAFKVASGELTNLTLLSQIANYRKPLIVSTGMASLDEVKTACRAIWETGNRSLALLHCVSSYPARAEDANLRAMATLSSEFHVPVGYSDHTTGMEVSFAAVALGACILEKHFTLDRNFPGPDQNVSLEPQELKGMVDGIRSIESALGDGIKRPKPAEAEIAAVARKSLVAAIDIPENSTLSPDMVAVKRPGTGLPPSMLETIIGRRTRRRIAAGELITREALR